MTALLTEKELREIEGREKAATKESVAVARYDHGGGRLSFEEGVGLQQKRALIADFYDESNREFYVAARADVPRLVADLRAAREALYPFAQVRNLSDVDRLLTTDFQRARAALPEDGL